MSSETAFPGNRGVKFPIVRWQYGMLGFTTMKTFLRQYFFYFFGIPMPLAEEGKRST
jgi:hypothetical protein